MITYISNKDFWYLNPDDRDHLKKDYHNYITNYDSSSTHYIQDTNEYYFRQHLEEVKALHKTGIDLHIFMNDNLGKSIGLIKEPKREPLF